MRTYFPTEEDTQQDRKWWLIDAEGLTLGRVASHAATLLRGKHKPTWTPFRDGGDHVIIVNCDKVVFTGRKIEKKQYRRHSGYPGGLKEVRADKLLAKDATRVVELAVKGMLPKNRLGRRMGRKVRAYSGPDHPHVAQQPEPRDTGLTRAGDSA